MKKSFLLAVVLLAFNSLFANPVDANFAKELGQKFVSANFVQKSNVLELVYTETSESGEPCFYIFNVSNNGFIIVSADDATRPILGYSENGAFDANNIVPGVGFMMEIYKESISYAKDNNIAATMNIASEWKSLEATGKTTPAMRGQGVGPLCTTRWNQSWPYNKFCPEQSASWASHGHVVVGCVATALSQVMAYWDYPVQGTGSHSYIPVCNNQDYGCWHTPSYPQQTVNFGATTYDWENMVDHIDASSPVEQIDAIATISYHCGVAVDMMYEHHGDGSGAHSTDVPAAVQSYFDYAPCYVTNFSNYTAWMVSLKNAIDMRRPVYYSGCATTGCHAFVCDGYDENQLYHFNYGWGGSGDGYFAPNAIEYSVSQVQAIFNLMPRPVYENAAQAPTNFTVVPADNNALSATLSWVNPSKSISNSALSNIDMIVVERNGEVVAEIENPTVGQSMTFVDENVPCFSYFDYTVCAVINGAYGEIASVEKVSVGPTCEWSLVLQPESFQGMRGAHVSVYDETGYRFEYITTTNGTLNTIPLMAPYGKLQFAWQAPGENQPAYNLTMLIKNANGETVFNFNGSSDEMQEGVFFTVNNNCSGDVQCGAPSNLVSSVADGQLKLTWNAAGSEPDYGYNVYRDGILIALTKETSFIDEGIPFGGHCYQVSALCDGGVSERTNEACGVLTEGCDPAKDLEIGLSANLKPYISWTAPETDGLSGYYIMRKKVDEDEWTRIKILGANKTDYTDNSGLTYDNWYCYQVIAYYQATDCMSAPAQAKYNNLEYYVKIYYSEDGVEDYAADQIGVYPNPADDKVAVEAVAIKNVTIFNMMGQKVYESSVDADFVELNTSELESGVYMIQVQTAEYTTTKRISIAH